MLELQLANTVTHIASAHARAATRHLAVLHLIALIQTVCERTTTALSHSSSRFYQGVTALLITLILMSVNGDTKHGMHG